MTAPTADPEFIRRAIELADLNAVRVALFQLTADPELAAMPPAADLDEPTRQLLIDKAVAWLEREAGPRQLPEPPEPELRRLMNMATGEQMPDLEFQARKDLPAFKDFPWMTGWTGAKPELPAGFRVVIIGSGFSGIAMGVQLELLGIPYLILERRAEPGGTWNVNRYPDVRVDTISITYEFSFEKNYPWSEYFGRGAEVRTYLDYVAKKYGTYENTLFGHDLAEATYDEATSSWTLEVDTAEGRRTFAASMLVNAVGTFANPKFPRFEAQETFEGTIVHPARWPEDLELAGKRVAVLGNGSTGVQLLAPVAAAAEQVFVFQRTPQWISPRERYGKAVEPEIRWLLDNFPGYWNWWHYMAIAGLFQTHRLLAVDEEWQANGGKVNPFNDKMRDDLTAYIKAQTNDRPDLVDRLIPDYAPFSRRAVVDNGWYRALTRDNVQLVTDGIARLTPKGIETADGTVHEVDIVVTATGYDVIKYLWPADYVGVDGVNLHDFWSTDGPRAYLGMMVPKFPNMFTIYGPNSQAVSGGSALPSWYVIWSAYAAQCMVRVIEQGAAAVEVKHEAYQRYNDALDEESQNLLIMKQEGAPEKNYYVNEFGRLQVNVPWYGPEYHRMCTEIAWEDIDIR